MTENQGCSSVPGLIAFSTFVIWLAASLAAHVTIALIAPGDAGTAAALVDGVLLFIVMIAIAPMVLVLFPVAAFVSWPLHKLAFDHPWLAFALGAVAGTLTGYFASFAYGNRGFVDQGPGLTGGLVAGMLWVLLVRQFGAELDSVQTDDTSA
jgi:hypothetical protein